MKKLLLTFLCLLGVMSFIDMRAEEKSIDLCQSWGKALAYASDYTYDYTLDGNVTLTIAAKGVYRQGKDNTYFQMNKKTGYLKNTTPFPGKITKIETKWSVAKGPTKVYFGTSADKIETLVTITAATTIDIVPPADGVDYTFFNIDPSTGSGAAQLTKCVVYYSTDSGDPDTPTLAPAGLAFDPATVTCEVDETIEVAFTKTTDAEVSFTSSNENVAVYEDGHVYALAAGTATITATCEATETYAAGTATLKVTVNAPLETVDNIEEFKELIDVDTKAKLTLNDAVVIAKATNGNVYIQDATGGICLYQNVPSTYAVGDRLNGTVIGTYADYKGLPELSDGDYTNVTATAGEAPVAKEINIDDITAADYCTLVTIKNAHCEGLKANAEITQEGSTGTIAIYTSCMPANQFPTYQNFDITGVVGIFNGTVQILPRSAADFVEIEGEKVTTITVEATRTAYVGMEINLDATVNSEATLTYESDNEAVATVDANGVVTGVTAGTAVITITAPEYNGYPEATATVTVTVSEAPSFVMLVVESTEHGFFALSSEAGKSKNSLAPVAVNVSGNQVVVDDINNVDTNLLWTIDAENGYIISYDGQYLAGANSGTNLNASDNEFTWTYDETIGAWTSTSGSDTYTVLYNYNNGTSIFRNYKIGNIGGKQYSSVLKPMTYTTSMFTLVEDITAANQYKLENGNYVANEIALSDDDTYVNGVTITANTATYSRTVNADEFNAICLPFEVPYEAWGAAGYTVIALKGDYSTSGDAVVFTNLEEGEAMKANTPYLVSTTGTEISFSISNADVKPATDATVAGADFTLVGTYAAQKVPAGSYALANGVFKKAAANNEHLLKPYRVYLTAKENAAKEMIRIVVKNNETEGIEGVTIEGMQDGFFYDMQGRKVVNPTTGIYIFNGKKVILN